MAGFFKKKKKLANSGGGIFISFFSEKGIVDFVVYALYFSLGEL